MKKIVLSVIAIFMAFVMMPVVKAEEKVPVYMFTKNGCPACVKAHEYFDELSSDYPDLFDLYVIEVFDEEWKVIDNSLKNLLIKVYEEYGADSSRISTPTIIIGDYHTIGLPQDTNLVYEAIDAAKDSEEKIDKVKKFAEELNVNLENFAERNPEETGKYDVFIIIGIFVVLIGGLAGLVVAGKK